VWIVVRWIACHVYIVDTAGSAALLDRLYERVM
jgi:hypothetical protein